MEAKYEITDWRELLGQVIRNAQEKKRLAQEAGVRPVTLDRWVERHSHPREENLRKVARVFSTKYSALFLQLIEEDYPSLTHKSFEQSSILAEIPAKFYAQVFQIYAKTPPALVRQTLQEIIFSRAIADLDPEKIGMSLVLICCVPPRPEEKIRGLRQIGGIATSPWEKDQERKPLFLGAESVAGNAVATCRMSEIESRDSVSFTPAHWTTFEHSAVAYPILRQGKIAGALLASSTRPYYFTQAHKNLLELYTYLTVLIFEAGEFYDPGDIKLGVMPDFSLQESHFVDFERRVILKTSQATAAGHAVSNLYIRQSVWQDIGDELLQFSGNNEQHSIREPQS